MSDDMRRVEEIEEEHVKIDGAHVVPGMAKRCRICFLLSLAKRLMEELSQAQAERDKWKRGWEEQLALLDQRDGPPVYSAVLKRAEEAEAQLVEYNERSRSFWKAVKQ